MSEQPPIMLPNTCCRRHFLREKWPPVTNVKETFCTYNKEHNSYKELFGIFSEHIGTRGILGFLGRGGGSRDNEIE